MMAPLCGPAARHRPTEIGRPLRIGGAAASPVPGACPAEDRISGDYIDRLTSGQREAGDSLHLLVMDLHKELNRLQQRLATETIDGAQVYGVLDDDRPLIAAFMAGVNRTRELKFDHPGLGTTATRSGERLVIQNDIGTTEAHVLVVHVEGGACHADLHRRAHRPPGLLPEPVRSFRRALAGHGVAAGRGAPEDLYHLCLGTYGPGPDRHAGLPDLPGIAAGLPDRLEPGAQAAADVRAAAACAWRCCAGRPTTIMGTGASCPWGENS